MFGVPAAVRNYRDRRVVVYKPPELAVDGHELLVYQDGDTNAREPFYFALL
jgi:hypothetical protein